MVGLDSITGLQTARILADRSVPVVRRRRGPAPLGRAHQRLRRGGRVAAVRPGPGDGSRPARPERLDRPAVLLPCTDAAVDTVSRHRDRAGRARIPPGARRAPRRRAAHGQGAVRRSTQRSTDLPVPRTEVLCDRADAEAAAAAIGYPCVLKPPYKTPVVAGAHERQGVHAVTDATTFLEVHTTGSSTGSPFLLAQEWIPGDEHELYSCNAVLRRRWPAARHLRRAQGAAVAARHRDQCVRRGVPQRRGARHHDPALRRPGLPRPGVPGDEARRPDRRAAGSSSPTSVARPAARRSRRPAASSWCTPPTATPPGCRSRPRAEQRYGEARWLDLRRDLQAALVARRRGTLTLRAWLRWVRGPKAHAIWSRRDPRPFVSDLTGATRTGLRLIATGRDGGDRAAVTTTTEEGVSA